jgi:hypothetical protein
MQQTAQAMQQTAQGAIVGGAAGASGSIAANVTGQVFDLARGKTDDGKAKENFDFGSLVKDTLIGGITGAAAGAAIGYGNSKFGAKISKLDEKVNNSIKQTTNKVIDAAKRILKDESGSVIFGGKGNNAGVGGGQFINGVKVLKTEGNVIHLENGTKLYKNRFGFEDFSKTNIKNLEIKNVNGKYKDYRGYTANKEYIYVIDENNNLITSYSDDVIHHSDLVKGGNVKYAGEMKFKNGKLEYWNNNSGHYQPLAGDASNVVDILNQNGITDASINNFIGVNK